MATTDEALQAIDNMLSVIDDPGAGEDELEEARCRLNDARLTLATELERLQAGADLAEILRATTDEYGRGSGEVVLTQTETGGVRIEMRCKPIADDTADGATIADAAREMVRRWYG